jgi:CBS domain-containing protein
MFHVYGLQGRQMVRSLDELKRLAPVGRTAAVRAVARHTASGDPEPTGPAPPHGSVEALHAYAAAAAPPQRAPLTQVADVMHAPAVTVPATATVREAWQTLATHHIGQAPVVDSNGTLVGLVGRADLLSADWLAGTVEAASAWEQRLAQPVGAVMWSPVPSVHPETDLRGVAALLLASGLPGVPVTDESGSLTGFVSRSDLLKAMVVDPPIDLWG